LWKVRGRIVDALSTVSVADLLDEPAAPPATVSRLNFVTNH
jgi:hypothetical protein